MEKTGKDKERNSWGHPNTWKIGKEGFQGQCARRGLVASLGHRCEILTKNKTKQVAGELGKVAENLFAALDLHGERARWFSSDTSMHSRAHRYTHTPKT